MNRCSDIHRTRRNAIFLAFIVVICSYSVLLSPAAGAPITASISTSPSDSFRMTASEYEQEGMALMAVREWNGLIALSSEGLLIYPDEAELMCLKAYALRKTGHFQEAVDLLNVAIPIDPRPARFANRGYALLAMGKTDEALADAEQAILLNSSYSPGHGLKAETLLAMKDYPGAVRAAGAALALEQGSAHYWHVKGKVLAGMGDCPGAIASLEHSVSIKSDYDMPWPGPPNASADLAQVQSVCMMTEETAAPTRTALPSLVVVAALAVAVAVKRKTGKFQ